MAQKKKRGANYIQSVDRALVLLEEIAANPDAKLGLAELARVLKIDPSSVFRLLSTLIKHGLVRQVDSRTSYQLGFEVFKLAGSLRSQLKITDVTAPFLRQLAEKSGENAHLAVRSGTLAVFIDRERGGPRVSANTNIGDAEPLHCTAVGRCLICEMGREDLGELFGGESLTAFTERTITDLDRLASELQSVREKGFAVDRQEFDPSLVCIAAPIYDFEGRVEASIGISGPKERVAPNVDAFSVFVRQAGKDISDLLGKR